MYNIQHQTLHKCSLRRDTDIHTDTGTDTKTQYSLSNPVKYRTITHVMLWRIQGGGGKRALPPPLKIG